MRRKQKRLLQLAGLLVASTLLFLPNVGLWSLYRDRVFDVSPAEVVEEPAGGGSNNLLPQIQVSRLVCCGSGVGYVCRIGIVGLQCKPPPVPQFLTE